MSLIETRRAGESQDLTELATVKTALGISGTGDDTTLNRLITVASHMIRDYTDRVLVREEVTERTYAPEGDLTRLMLQRTPVRMVQAIRLNGTDLDISDVIVSNDGSGFLYRPGGFVSTMIRRQVIDQIVTRLAEPDWEVDYVAGYVPPSFATVSETFTSSEVDTDADTITITGHGLVTGDPVRFSTDDTLPAPLSANRDYLVRDAGDNTFTLALKPTTEDHDALSLTSGGAGTHTVERQTSLPDSLQQDAIQVVAHLYHSQARDPNIEQEKLGDWSARYAGIAGGAGGLPPMIAARLDRWRDETA